jgi:hypothetical protein
LLPSNAAKSSILKEIGCRRREEINRANLQLGCQCLGRDHEALSYTAPHALTGDHQRTQQRRIPVSLKPYYAGNAQLAAIHEEVLERLLGDIGAR